MDNFFDQFDAAPATNAGASVPSSENFFDQFDPQPSAPALTVTPGSGAGSASGDTSGQPQGILTNSPDDGWLSGFAKGAGTAAVRAGAMVAGMGGDLGNVLKLSEAYARKIRTGEDFDTALQNVNAAEAQNDKAFESATGVNPSLPTSGQVEDAVENKTGIGRYDPTTAAGRIAQAAGSAVLAGGVTPEALLADGAKGVASAVGRNIVDQAVPNAAAGAAAQGAGELAQDSTWSPGTSTAVQLGAGLVGGMMGGAMKSVGTRFTPAGRDAAVGADLLRSSSNPAAVKAALNSDAPPSLVAGSSPTTAELTGDAGLGVLQDRAATADPATWNTREDQNNAARIAALKATAPADADAMAPATTFADRLDAIQAAGQQVRDDMTAAHADAVQQLNGAYQDDAAARQQAGADFASQQQSDLADRTADRQADLDADTAAQAGHTSASRDALTNAFEDRLTAAQQAADAGNTALGAPIAPEVAGQVLRDHLQAAADQEQATTRALYNAVDPDGSLYAVAQPVKAAVQDIKSGIDPIAGVQPSGVEADLHQAIAGMPDVVPFRSLQALDSRVGAAMADARRNPSASDPQALARLTQLKGATLDAVNNAVEHQQNYEQNRVAQGTLDPQNTVASRLDGLDSKLQGNPGRGAGSSVIEAGPNAGRSPDAVSGVGGTGKPSSVGPASSPGVPAVAGDASTGAGTPISDLLKSTGGVQDPQGALAARGLDSVVAKPGAGLGANAARQVAEQAGLLPKGSTVADLHDALSAEQSAGSLGAPSPNMAVSGAAERLAAAKAQAQISAAYKAGPVGEALKSTGFKGQYKMAPEAVARAATRDYSSAKAFISKGGNAPEVAGHLGELLTNELRSRVNPTGQISPTALAAWEQKNSGAIRAVREVDPSFGKGFADAAKATDALVQLGQERAATLKQFELEAAARGADAFTAGRSDLRAANTADKAATAKSIADRRTADAEADASARATRDAGIAQSKAATGAQIKAADDVVAQAKKLPGAELATKTDPSEVSKFMGKLVEDQSNGPTKARQFMTSIANDPAAVNGARKALVDHIVAKVENGTVSSAGDRALSAPKLRNYLADNAAALKAIMPEEHLNAWNAVAADLDRRDVPRAAARTTNSATASRLLPAIKAAGHVAGHGAGGAAWVLALESMMQHGVSWHSAGMAAAPFALGAGKKLAASALGREQRIRANLLTEALLRPDVARHYIRAAGHTNPTAGTALVNTLRRGFTGLQAVR